MSNAVLVLDPRGSVLATSGLPELLGRADVDAAAEIDLSAIVAPLNGDDLARALADAAGAAPGSHPRSLMVRPAERDGDEPRDLTLHRIGDSFVMGVLTPGGAPGRADLDMSESTLRRLWSGLSEGMALATRGTGDLGPTIVAANEAFGALFGLDPEQARGRRLIDFLAPGDGVAMLERVHRAVTLNLESLTDLTVIRARESAATVVQWELAPVLGRDGKTEALILVLRDVTRPAPWAPVLKTREYDPLSGLPNRLQLISRLERSVERSLEAHSYSFAVIGIEVEGLRAVERRLGTAVANALLDALVWRVRRELRPGDLIARVGGERLAMLLDYFAPGGPVDQVLNRIQRATEEPYSIAGERLGLRAIGAAGPVWSSEHVPSTAVEVLDELERAVSSVRTRGGRNGGRA